MASTGETFEQPKLDFGADASLFRTVSWIEIIAETKRRRWPLKDKVIRTFAKGPHGLPGVVTIPADDIAKITDPDLQYALRLQDATEAADWHDDGAGFSHQSVDVEAIGKGTDAKFVHATYSGVAQNDIDSFMENLHRFDPNYTGNYGCEQ